MIVQGSCVFKRQHVVISFSKYFFFSQGCINFRVIILGPLRLSQRCWPRQRGRRGSGLPPPPCHTPEVQTQFEIDKKIWSTEQYIRTSIKKWVSQPIKTNRGKSVLCPYLHKWYNWPAKRSNDVTWQLTMDCKDVQRLFGCNLKWRFAKLPTIKSFSSTNDGCMDAYSW